MLKAVMMGSEEITVIKRRQTPLSLLRVTLSSLDIQERSCWPARRMHQGDLLLLRLNIPPAPSLRPAVNWANPGLDGLVQRIRTAWMKSSLEFWHLFRQCDHPVDVQLLKEPHGMRLSKAFVYENFDRRGAVVQTRSGTSHAGATDC